MKKDKSKKAQEDIQPKRRGQFSLVVYRFRKNKVAMLGLSIFLIVLFFIIFAGLFADYEADAVKQDVYNRLTPPNKDYIFGTDAYGRNLFARIIYGGRLSLVISLVTVGISLVAGTLMGSSSAYYGGLLDSTIMRATDVFMAVPSALMAVTVVAALGVSVQNLVIALIISQIPPMTRIVRSAVLQVKNSDYIEAAKSYGAKDPRVIFSHILPNVVGPLIVQTTLNLANVLLSVAALGFIGLGVPSPLPEWGTMLAENKANMRYFPYLVLFPGLAIAITVLALNLIGDGLRDALDPRLKN